MSDINTAVVDSLKTLDPDRPIREADIGQNWREMAWSLMTRGGHGRSQVFPDCVNQLTIDTPAQSSNML